MNQGLWLIQFSAPEIGRKQCKIIVIIRRLRKKVLCLIRFCASCQIPLLKTFVKMSPLSHFRWVSIMEFFWSSHSGKSTCQCSALDSKFSVFSTAPLALSVLEGKVVCKCLWDESESGCCWFQGWWWHWQAGWVSPASDLPGWASFPSHGRQRPFLGQGDLTSASQQAKGQVFCGQKQSLGLFLICQNQVNGYTFIH